MLDFGRVLPGSVVSEEVWIINASETAVTVLETHSTCGCTVAHLTERTINPGDGIPARVQLTVPRRNSSIRKQVRFSFAGGLPESALTVEAQVAQPVIVRPRSLQADRLTSTEIVVESTDDRSFEILDTVPSVLSQDVAKGSSARHVMKIDEMLWRAAGQPSKIVLKLNHPEVSEVQIPVRSARARLQPTAGSRPPQQPQSRYDAAVEGSNPHVQGDNIMLGDVPRDGIAEIAITLAGRFANEMEPRLTFQSHLVRAELGAIARAPDSCTLTIRFVPLANRTGNLHDHLRVQIGDARVFYAVFGTVSEPLSEGAIP